MEQFFKAQKFLEMFGSERKTREAVKNKLSGGKETHRKEKHKMTNNQNDKIQFPNMQISKLSF